MEAALTSTFLVAGIASLVLAAFCLVLPHTPPSRRTPDRRSHPWSRSSCWPCRASSCSSSSLSSIPWSTIATSSGQSRYSQNIGVAGELDRAGDEHRSDRRDRDDGRTSGLFLKRLGWRTTMIIGVLGHVVRFGIYSLTAKIPACSGWSSSATSCTVLPTRSSSRRSTSSWTKTSRKDVRTSAQSLFNLLILGLGPLLGNTLWGRLGDNLTRPR